METCSSSLEKRKSEIPFWKKVTLSIEEAAAYSGIGVNKLRELTDTASCSFVLWVGNKRLIKRKQFEEYLDKSFSL